MSLHFLPGLKSFLHPGPRPKFFALKKGLSHLLMGVIKRKILLYAAFMHFCFKVQILESHFES